jgi:hypothetical protein
MSDFITGTSVFSCLTKYDEYMGESTGKYNLTVTLSDEDAAKLEDLGVRLKEYDGKMQRKFSSKFDVEVWDAQGEPFVGEIPRGSEVRVLYSLGPVSPQWGPTVYMNKVRVVKEAEPQVDVPDEF